MKSGCSFVDTAGKVRDRHGRSAVEGELRLVVAFVISSVFSYRLESASTLRHVLNTVSTAVRAYQPEDPPSTGSRSILASASSTTSTCAGLSRLLTLFPMLFTINI